MIIFISIRIEQWNNSRNSLEIPVSTLEKCCILLVFNREAIQLIKLAAETHTVLRANMVVECLTIHWCIKHDTRILTVKYLSVITRLLWSTHIGQHIVAWHNDNSTGVPTYLLITLWKLPARFIFFTVVFQKRIETVLYNKCTIYMEHSHLKRAICAIYDMAFLSPCIIINPSLRVLIDGTVDTLIDMKINVLRH